MLAAATFFILHSIIDVQVCQPKWYTAYSVSRKRWQLELYWPKRYTAYWINGQGLYRRGRKLIHTSVSRKRWQLRKEKREDARKGISSKRIITWSKQRMKGKRSIKTSGNCEDSYQALWTPKMHCRWSSALWTSYHIVGQLTMQEIDRYC